MDIDFLLTQKGEVGLLSSENLFKKVSGVLFDHENGRLALEYTDMDYLDLNIPIEEEYFNILNMCLMIHIGTVKNGNISQAYQVPLMFLNDPYRTEIFKHVTPPSKPLESFHYFIKSCVLGQPVHRKDTGDESTLGCILGNNQPSDLKFAPHLARRYAIESKPEFIESPDRFSAPAMGMGTNSGTGSSSAHTIDISRYYKKPKPGADNADKNHNKNKKGKGGKSGKEDNGGK